MNSSYIHSKKIKKNPSSLIQDQLSGYNISQQFKKPKIIEHRNIGNFSTYKDSAVPVDSTIFQPEPAVIQFHNYQPLQVKEQILKLRNKDSVTRKVKIIPPDSKLFQVLPLRKKNFNTINSPGKSMKMLLSNVHPSKNTISKPNDVDIMKSTVAPGMQVGYIIRFTPEAKNDYSCDLVIQTERERFTIPVKATGSRAMIQFPDVLDFARIPVKYNSEKPIMMRNVGEKATKWHISLPKNFSIAGNKSEGILEVGSREQLVFRFTPQESRIYNEQLVLSYDGLQAYIPIHCESHDDNVFLTKNYIQLDNTYITLYSQQYFQIANKSQVPARFSWRAFPNEKEENQKKMRLISQLSQEEVEQRFSIEQAQVIDPQTGLVIDSDDDNGGVDLDSDDSYDEEELAKKKERSNQKKIAQVSRKFANIRKQVEEDSMLFQDDIFSIEPLEGQIWPNQEIQICVTFKPSHPLRYTCTAFSNITCSEERLPLNLVGFGIGPKASLSMRECDIGDIFVNYPQRFDLVISNDGQIECQYKLMNYETPFGAKFQFDHSQGILEVGARQKLSVTFQSDILGEFSQTFHWQLVGSQEMLMLTFKGHVVAPTFEFSEKIIDFGKVSYNFAVVKRVTLTNTSLVPITYAVRIPGDGRHSSKPQFKVTPNNGTLQPTQKQLIDIEFIPNSAQKYDMVLVIDLDGVGQDMISVPIRAECIVPSVRINPVDFLEFKQIFLRHPRSVQLALINQDDLPARFEFIKQDDASKRIATYTQDHPDGIIKPKSTFIVNVTLKTELLGAIRVPLYLKVDGHQIQFQLTVLATSIGPIVEVNRSQLDFGTVTVLKDSVQQISVKNTSDIAAEYTAFTKQKNSIWRALQRHGMLQPKQSRTIDVVCNADQCMRFVDTLHIVVNNGVDLQVALKARGQGTTLFCKDLLSDVQFGTQYTFTNITREFFLENRGRKAQKITWARQQKPSDRQRGKKGNADEQEKKKSDKSKKGGKAEEDAESKKPEQQQEEVKFIFSILPETMNLLPKMGVFVQFRANARDPGEFQETFICQTVSGGDRKPKPVYTTNLKGNFVNPTLSYSDPKLFFKYIWQKGVPFMPISKTLDIMNSGPLPTSLSLKIAPPFSCNIQKLQLQPGKSQGVKIDFEPGMNQDRISDVISGKLAISHAPHPHRENVELIGQMCFPNLVISPTQVRFGCILNDTTKKKYITLSNQSQKACHYQWSFLEQEFPIGMGESLTAPKRGKKGAAAQKKKLPINQVFDILPVSGVLLPGQKQVVEFTYYAGNALSYDAKAICSVQGGPNYQVPISGQSSYVDYKLSTNELDFGEIAYNDSAQKEFYIENIGKVAYEFVINTSSMSRPGIVEVFPSMGRCGSGQKQKIVIKFFAGIPDTIDETFLVEVAHFPAEKFRIKAIGMYAGVIVTLPRSEQNNFSKRYEDVKKQVSKKKIPITSKYKSAFVSKELKPIPMPGGLKPARITPSGQDAVIMDCQVEADRRFLCNSIVRTMEDFYTRQAMKMTAIGMSSANLASSAALRASKTGKRSAARDGFGGGAGQQEKQVLNIDHIKIAYFTCDFGNMVVGSSKKKQFKLFNVGKLPVTFNFDKKALQNAGLIIQPDRVNKLMPNCGAHFNVNFQTRKTAKFGMARHFIDIDVYRGPSTVVQFCANLTIPQLHIETDNIDFGEVCVGFRKTIKIRLENKKEVPCHWSFFSRQDLASGSGKDGEKFSVKPATGHLQPGSKTVIDVMFIPTGEKQFVQKLAFKVAENPKHFVINAKGHGLFMKMEIVADHLKLGPVLPYKPNQKEFVIKNLMNFPIQVFAIDFDQQHVYQEELLRRLQVFQPEAVQQPQQQQQGAPASRSGDAQPVIEPLYLSWRKPGEQFWPELRQADERRERTIVLKKRIKEIDQEIKKLNEVVEAAKKVEDAPAEGQKVLSGRPAEGSPPPPQDESPSQQQKAEKEAKLRSEKEQIQNELAQIQTAKKAAELAAKGGANDYPLPVKRQDRVNTIIYGPASKCGVTKAAKYVAEKRRKGLINFGQLFDWLKSNGKSNLVQQAENQLKEKAVEMQAALAEYEKQKKKLKKGQQMDPFDETPFKQCSQSLMSEIINFRLSKPDCNGGAIFYNTENASFAGQTKGTIKAISNAVSEQNLQLLAVKLPRDQNDNELLCYNIQKGRRGQGKTYLHQQEQEDEEGLQNTKEEQAKGSKASSPEKAENKKQENKAPGGGQQQLEEHQNQDQQPKDPQEIQFMTVQQVQEYEEKLKQIVTLMASLSMNKIQQEALSQAAQDDDEKKEDQAKQQLPLSEEKLGTRFITELWMRLDQEAQNEAAYDLVQEPIWPDPDKEPLPPPQIHQIVKKPNVRAERHKVQLFQICTVLSSEQQKEGGGSEEQAGQVKETYDQARWTIGPKSQQSLKIKFLSKKIGHYDQTLPFEIYGSPKQFNLQLGGDCEFPTINTNYKNVFMKHKKLRPPAPPESYLNRCYVISQGKFDFGPLLVGKDAEKRGEMAQLKRSNASSFRITNNGKYQLHAQFALRQPAKPQNQAPAEPKGKGAAAAAPEKAVFFIQPQELTLNVDQTQNVTVWCFPDRAQHLNGQLVTMIKDNPNPAIFKLSTLGALPIIELDADKVDFDRLLLNQSREKTITIKNVSAIPINWKLDNLQTMPQQFTIDKKAGTLQPTEETVVSIVFKTVQPKMLEHKIKVSVEDTQGFGVKQEPVQQFTLVAEAFDITVALDFPKQQGKEENVLDFEDVRVGQAKQREFKLKNNGKYNVKYNFALKYKSTREMFTVTPSQGQLQPNEEIEVKVKFLSMKKQVKMRTSKTQANIRLQILQGASQEKFNELPIYVNVNAVFSKYSVTPLKNINFGPMMYGESRVRSLEIKNNGLFEFAYEICDFADEEAKAKIKATRDQQKDTMSKLPQEREGADPAPAKGGKKQEKKAPPKKEAKGKGAAAGPPPDALVLQQFLVNPYTGTIAPGSSAVVQVTFNALGAKFYNKTLAIDIANRDPADQPEGITFQLAAESCVPGINTQDMDSIFEEQTVIPAMDPSDTALQQVLSKSFFVVEDNVFFFGTIVASKMPEGVVQKFKISNPFKIPCAVNFACKPKQQSKHQGFAFEVSPESLRIPPHQHAYVKVAFKPVNMMPYSGILEANVESGTNPQTAKLEFDLRGQGTLPTLSIEQPKVVKPDDGTPLLRFRKTRVGQKFVQTISLKNQGPVQATCRFDNLKHDDFRFLGQISYTIPPKSYQTFDIAFQPKKVGQMNYLLNFETVHNPYEHHKVLLQGEAYEESLMFEGLPDNAEDQLQFGDCIVNKRKKKIFNMTNNTAEWMRIEWRQSDKTTDFKFSPSVAHIAPRASKPVEVRFVSEQTVTHENIPYECVTSNIRPAQPSSQDEEIVFLSDWGNDKTQVRMVRPSEFTAIMKRKQFSQARKREEIELAALMAKDKKAGAAMKKKLDEEAKARGQLPPIEDQIDMNEEETEELVQSIPEPRNEVQAGTEKSVMIKVSATSDFTSFECETKEILFKPTLMFQNRAHKFSIKNTSKIALSYHWKIVNPETEKIDNGPYTILPRMGEIPPGCDENFVMTFSPHQIQEHFSRVLVGSIKNLKPGSEPLVIDVAGVAQRPICHFELPPSVYRQKKARDMTPIDSKYNIIEFESLGTKIKNTKRFMVINPTNFAYQFEWTSSHQKSSQGSGGSVPLFRPLTKKGTILSGKKFEMVFQYTPDKVGTHESFWLFKIPKCNIVQHFMVVGMVHEPTVLFETGKVNFGPLLIDGKNRETVYLVNQEHIPFTFNFDRESVKGSPDYADSLSVSPMSGVVSPQSKIAIEIVFKPRLELTYNYNLVCNVKRKMRPLVLNVKGVGYTIKHQVFAGETASTPVSKHIKEPTPVQFGDFFVNEKRTRKIAVENQGAFNFDFVWKRAVNASNNKYITISPESGTVKQGQRGQFQITYFPLSDHKLTQFKASLQIVSGPKYDFQLIGSARKPGIKLSFHSYDFGPSFVMRQPMKKIAILEMRNHDEEAISIQSLFEKTPFLDVQLPPGQVLLPTHSIEVPIIFTPREIKKYEEVVKFDFNGIHKMELKVAGEGIPMVIELVDPDNHLVDFGIVPVKGDVTKNVQIVNKSRRPVNFTLMPSDQQAWGRNCLELSPEKQQFLKPRQKLNIEVRFRPKERLQPFQNSIMLQIKDNQARKIFTVNGVSHGIELKLMEEVLGFGQVVAGSFLTKKVQLANFGDVGAKFIWDSKAYNKYFHISPQKAYIPPHQDIYLQVTFKPQNPDKDIRCSDIQCKVEGSPQPLKLTLLGSCIAAGDASMKQLEFQTIVRKQQLKTVTIENPTEKKWAINPTISMTHDIGGEKVQYYTGPKTLEVPPKGKADYEISYTPLTMTKDPAAAGGDQEQEVKSQSSVKQALNSKPDTHDGALFFPLPDGSALHYKLIGKSLPPKVEDTIQQEVIAKQVNYININVKNWLHKETQRFNVRQEVKDALDPTTRILGASTIDIGGNQSKIYKLSFVTYKAGISKFTVVFQNRKSGQYCLYDVEIKAVQSDQAKDVELACPVRQTASQMIQLDNPMDKGVQITRAMFTISDQLVDIQPEQFTIPPKSESSFELIYRPLVQGEKQADVLLKSNELGEFRYNLRLVGLASTQQRSLNFKASLGSDAVSTFKFKHFLKKAIGYTVKLQTLDGNPLQNFKAEPAVVQAPACQSKAGVDAQVNIRYEPNSLGQTRGILKLNSPDGGDYTCLLQGLCVAPSPQGPIKIPLGKPVNVGFRNPLSEKCDFSIHFDNENFSNAGKPGGPLDPGKEMQVQVKYEAKNSQPTGRMIISAKGLPQWVYYLHGEA